MGEQYQLSIIHSRFWDLWLQKLFRNFVSLKFMVMVMLYIPAIWGMFTICIVTGKPWISDKAGLMFLGGGFVTLALGRVISKTTLRDVEPGSITEETKTVNGVMDSDS